MNTTKKHHAAIFTTPDQLHFLITGECTFDTFCDAIYKPYLIEETVPLEMASFQAEDHDINGRNVRFGEYTGEDGAILWHDEFSTVADATTAMADELRSMLGQIDRLANVLVPAPVGAAANSLEAKPADEAEGGTSGEESCAPDPQHVAAMTAGLERVNRILPLIGKAPAKVTCEYDPTDGWRFGVTWLESS